ncbi:hypothetical protein PMAYCL1PPCAC_04483, partial [Pristionchus mayeri]
DALLPDEGDADEQLVVEDVTVDDVANEIVVDDIPGSYDGKRRKQYAATTLRTSDFLKGRPRVYVPPGRVPFGHIESKDEEEDPPRLSDPDGSYATPSMRQHFRIYADATLRKATRIFQGGESTSQPGANQGEVVAVVESAHGLASNVDVETGEELEQLLDEPEELEPQEGMNSKQNIFYGTEEEHTTHFEMHCPLYGGQPIDFPEACELLIGNSPVTEDKVCKSTPQGFKGTGTYIVDWTNIEKHEIGMDGFGSWGKPSGRTRFYRLNPQTNKYVCVSDARGQLPKGNPYDVKCQLMKYEHPTTTALNNGHNRFIKKIISCVWKDPDSVSRLAIITYDWIGTPFDFDYELHPRRTRNIPPPPDGALNWEAASFQNSALGSFPASCHVMMGDCPLYSMGAIQFQDVCQIIMGGTVVDDSKICDRIPQRFRECGTFVISVSSLGSEHELRRDDNGQWGKPAGNSRYFKYESEGVAKRIDRSGKLDPGARVEGAYDVQILCKRYEHPQTDNRFVRKIYTARRPPSKDYQESFSLAVITYFWKGDPIPFDSMPQRKVRVHNSSNFEIAKRSRGMRLYEDEGGDMMEMEEYGGNMYMEDDTSALIDGGAPNSILDRPASKRMKLGGVSMATEQQEMQPETSGMSSDQDMQYAKLAFENQERFAMLLDRFELVAERMEKMTEMQMNMMWRARQYPGEHEQRDRPEEEVQYVEEEVYDME